MLFLNILQFDNSGDLAYSLQVCGYDFFQGLIFTSRKGC